MTGPAVSVVVPCFNGGRFLHRLTASLAGQTFRDFETVIVDDGSSDPATRDAIAALPADIRVVRQENRGLPGARNAGFAAAQADLVLPLDCDDEIAPSFLAESVAALRAAGPDVAFVFTDMQLVGEADGVRERRFNAFDQRFVNQLPYCMLLRKAAWQAVGGYDARMRDGYEDWEFNIRLGGAGFRGLKIEKPLFIYHVSAQGMLFRHSARLHGRLWRAIRRANPDLYRPAALLRLYRACRQPPPRIGLAAGLFLLYADAVLPEAVVNRAFNLSLRLRHWLRARSGRGSASAPAP